MNPRPIIATTSLLSTLIVAVAVWWWLIPAQRGAVTGFLLTADQQAGRLLATGDPSCAAKRFRDPMRQAAAHYRAGSFKEAAGIWVGQQVRLRLDVLGLDGWATIERLPDLEVPGAQAMRVESQGTRLTETIAGESYSGQRYQWLLFPQRAGTLSVPGLPVRVVVKTFGVGADPQVHELQTPPLSFAAALPSGAEGLAGLISTSELEVSQTWEPQTTELAPGDGIERRILREAAGISGMAFTPLSHEAINGVAIYPGEPEVADEVDRGSLERGKRIETVTYVPERAGEFLLPALSFHWWDVKAQVLRESTLKDLLLTVAPAAPAPASAWKSGAVPPAVGASAALPEWLGIALVAAAVAGGLAWLWKRRLSSLWRAYQARRSERDPAYFERFVITPIFLLVIRGVTNKQGTSALTAS